MGQKDFINGLHRAVVDAGGAAWATGGVAAPGPAAAGFWRMGWEGMSVALPAQWNLCFHRGDARRGTLIFADLREPQLEIRWRTPGTFWRRRNAGEELQRMIGRATRGAGKAAAAIGQKMATRDGTTAFRMVHGGRTVVLMEDGRRCYELLWPGTAEHVEEIAADFLANTARAAEAEMWWWSVYGVAGEVPARARLREARLLPGECRLSFSHGPTRRHAVVLGGHGLADRVLRETSLRTWAERAIWQVKHFAGGRWTESASEARYEVRRRRWLSTGERTHRVELFHDQKGNRIYWSYRCWRNA